jgi:hypothetical protein
VLILKIVMGEFAAGVDSKLLGVRSAEERGSPIDAKLSTRNCTRRLLEVKTNLEDLPDPESDDPPGAGRAFGLQWY